MSRGVNRVTLIGHLGDAPELRYTPSGTAVANLRIATSEQWTDKQTGERKEATEWHTVVMWNKLAEIAAEYLGKGAQVYVEGKLRTEKWQDKHGNDRYTTKIQADQLVMLGGGGGGRGDGQQKQANADEYRRAKEGGRVAAPASQGAADFDDDIPF